MKNTVACSDTTVQWLYRKKTGVDGKKNFILCCECVQVSKSASLSLNYTTKAVASQSRTHHSKGKPSSLAYKCKNGLKKLVSKNTPAYLQSCPTHSKEFDEE